MLNSLIFPPLFGKMKTAFLKKGIDWCHVCIYSRLFVQDNKSINMEVEQ